MPSCVLLVLKISNQGIKEDEDEDIRRERRKVLTLMLRSQKTPLVLKEVTKVMSLPG